MAERQKSPREKRKFNFDLAPQISAGAALSTLLGFASRKVTSNTTLAATLNAEDTTVSLNANPGVGAMLIVQPGDVVAEETFKVTFVSGGGPFICTILPTAEQQHSSGAAATYEPGESARFLVSTAPAPSGTLAPFEAQEGADNNTYRVSVLGTCNNGEVVEDELDLEVVEFAPVSGDTIDKQPDETKDIAIGFDDWTSEYSTSLSSAIAFVARESTTSTTVSGSPSAGATSISLVIHPGVGALLIVNPAGPNQEKLLVSAVGAGPPYPCTVSPLQFNHTVGETVTVSPGVTARVLVSSTATIVGTEAIFRSRRGAAGQTYFFAVVATLADGQLAQKNFRLVIEGGVMQPRRLTERIELGTHEGRVGFIMHFTDGTSEAFLFDLKTAHDLFTQGLTLLESLQQAQHAAQLPHSGVGMGDAVKMRLVKSED